MSTQQKQKPTINDKLLTIEETAKTLGNVGIGVIYRAVSRGELGSVRVGRRIMIPESDINRYLGRNYQPASSR